MQKVFGFLFVFVLAPVCTGLLWTKALRKEKCRAGNIYLAGFLTQLAAFQIIAVPVMIREVYGMQLLVELTSAVLALLSCIGLIAAVWQRCRKKKEAPRRERDGGQSAGANKKNGRRSAGAENALLSVGRSFAALSLECKLFWLLALAAIVFQMYMSYAYASFDGDDSYYVVQSVLADQTGVLNRIRPYTGLSTDLDIRHALATLPLWEAYVARMTGIHAAIVAHTLLPLVFIPLTYLCYFKIGRKLLDVSDIKLPIFMTLVSIMQIWGNASIYTNATFFLTRTWQGKSILANLILLVQIWLLLEIFDDKEEGSKAGYWGLLIVNNIAAAMMTSMGAFLAAMFLGIAGLVAAIRHRRGSVLLKSVLCCVPNVVYLLLLVAMG